MTDTYICSYPKSGRTWLRYTLAQYCQRLLQSDTEVGFKTLGKVFHDHNEPPRHKQYDYFPPLTFGHVPPTATPEETKRVVWLTRDVCDTLVSHCFHMYVTNQIDRPTMFKFAKDNMVSWCKFANASLSYSGELLTITYKQLFNYRTLESILDFCGIETNFLIMKEAHNASTFDKMQKDELEHPMHPGQATTPEDLRVRKGEIGGYKRYLNKDELKELKTLCYDNLNDPTKSYLETLGILQF